MLLISMSERAVCPEPMYIRWKSGSMIISEFMMDNIGNLLSPNNISETLKNDESEITRKTVSKYIDYLENAFLFYEAKRYDLRGKKYLSNNSKYYLCDSSFRYAVNGTRNMDFGRILFIWNYADEDMRYMWENSIKKKWTLWLRNGRRKYIFR